MPTHLMAQAHGSCTSVPQLFPSGRLRDARGTGPQDPSLRLCRSAEGVGFEPTVTRQRHSGFQDLHLNLADQRRLRRERRTRHAFGRGTLGRSRLWLWRIR